MPDKNFWHTIKKKLEALEWNLQDADWESMAQKMDQAFDDQLRAKFDLHSESFEEAEWENFISKAGPSLNPEQHGRKEDELFDSLKDKLDSFTLPLEEEAWLKFEEASQKHHTKGNLHSAPSTDNPEVPILRMEVYRMDDIIRSKLSNYSLPLFQGDWLDMLETLEGSFDQQIHNSLQTYQVPNQKADWRLMSILLDQVYGPVRSFPWMRSLAAAVVFFAFLIGGNYWIKQNDIPSSFSDWISRKATPTRLAPELEQQLADGKKAGTTQNTEKVQLPLLTDSLPVEGESLMAFVRETAKSEKTKVDSWDVSNAPPIELINASTLDSQSKAVLAEQKSKATMGSEEEELFEEGFHPRNNYQVSKMGVMAVNELWEMQEDNNPWMPSLGRKKIDLWLGLYAGTAQTKAELSGPKADRRGYTTGIRALVPLNKRWAVLTGIAYGKKEFKYAYGFGEFSSGMTGSLTMVDVPILLRYEFPSENELKLYLQGGAVTTLSLLEDHQVYSPRTPQNGGIQSRSPFGNEPSSYQQKLNTYPGNILLSFGVARPIGDRFRVEVEPYFLQNLQRTGVEESLGTQKRLYTAGVGLSIFMNTHKKN